MKNLSLLLLAIAIGVGYTMFFGTRSEPEMARCVDTQNHVVADGFCQSPTRVVAVRGSINEAPQYRRYFGGFGSFALGSAAWGGVERPLAGHVYRSAPGQDATPSLAAKSVRPDFYLGSGYSGR